MRWGNNLLAMILIVSFMVLMPGSSGELPDTFEVRGVPLDGKLINPLNASVVIDDSTEEDLMISWYLDGEKVADGEHIQRYIYPGTHNLTVTIEDDVGGSISRSFLLDPVPPPGWGEEPDNDRNMTIFWIIFGSGGLVFAGVAAWIWIKKYDDPGT